MYFMLLGCRVKWKVLADHLYMVPFKTTCHFTCTLLDSGFRLQAIRFCRYWKAESATRWLSTLSRSRNNDSPWHKCDISECRGGKKKKRAKQWWHGDATLPTRLRVNAKIQRRGEGGGKEGEDPSLRDTVAILSLSPTHSLLFCLSFYQPSSQGSVSDPSLRCKSCWI